MPGQTNVIGTHIWEDFVGDVELSAGVHDDGRYCRVVRVADVGEQVVHHLCHKSTKIPQHNYKHLHSRPIQSSADARAKPGPDQNNTVSIGAGDVLQKHWGFWA